MEAESLYIPNQDKDCLLKTADGAIPVRLSLWLCGSDLRQSILEQGAKKALKAAEQPNKEDGPGHGQRGASWRLPN